MMTVWIGLMFGRIAKTVSPTRPLEADAMPASLMGMLRPVRLTSFGRIQRISILAGMKGTHIVGERDPER